METFIYATDIRHCIFRSVYISTETVCLRALTILQCNKTRPKGSTKTPTVDKGYNLRGTNILSLPEVNTSWNGFAAKRRYIFPKNKHSKTSFEKNCFSAWASTLNMGLINKVDMVCLSPVGYGV